MNVHLRTGLWALALLGAAGILATYGFKPPLQTVQGAVVTYGRYSTAEAPIAGVKISAEGDILRADAVSDFSGFFTLHMRPEVPVGTQIVLKFRHPGFQPLDLEETFADRLYVVRMKPLAAPPGATIAIKDVLVRYSVENTTTANVGTSVKVFDIRNSGNKPCVHGSPCSPDGTFKAALGTASLDAGEGNEFRNARVSCLAGPCPFTRIQSDHFSAGGRSIGVAVLNWSDTVTYLLQAEVFRQEIGDITRTYHPVILGRALHFTLPEVAQGPSIVADLDGQTIVFPLSSTPNLSWAGCEVQSDKRRIRSYRCELKPGFAFK